MFVLRIFIGVVFLVSGGEKLLSPRENFLYVIQGYDALPWPVLEQITSFVFPWAEFMIGGFLVLGLWTRLSLWAAGGCFLTFIALLAQAQIRRLPLQDCGCFGELFKFPLAVTMNMDIIFFYLVVFMARRLPSTMKFSLDRGLARDSTKREEGHQ